MRFIILVTLLSVVVYFLWPTTSKIFASPAKQRDFFMPLTPEQRKEVDAMLARKGKERWLFRDKGYGVLTFRESDEIVRESFDYLDCHEALMGIPLHDKKPLFDDDYANQEGKSDHLSQALEVYLTKHIPFMFSSLAGDRRVDVVTLPEEHNAKAYVFIIRMNKDFITFQGDFGRFYYEIPPVLQALEDFIKNNQAMEPCIWLSRGEGFFMFVVQQRI